MICPPLMVILYISLSLLNFEFPLKTQTNDFLTNSAFVVSKIVCSLKGREWHSIGFYGKYGGECLSNCPRDYQLPNIGEIGLPTDTTWPPCYCKGNWVNNVCRY